MIMLNSKSNLGKKWENTNNNRKVEEIIKHYTLNYGFIGEIYEILVLFGFYRGNSEYHQVTDNLYKIQKKCIYIDRFWYI